MVQDLNESADAFLLAVPCRRLKQLGKTYSGLIDRHEKVAGSVDCKGGKLRNGEVMPQMVISGVHHHPGEPGDF
jgi:hypothetical protein